jgi:hypothetical protein
MTNAQVVSWIFRIRMCRSCYRDKCAPFTSLSSLALLPHDMVSVMQGSVAIRESYSNFPWSDEETKQLWVMLPCERAP